MFSVDRRSFLHQAANAGVAWGASSLLGGAFLGAQTSPLSANDVARVYRIVRRDWETAYVLLGACRQRGERNGFKTRAWRNRLAGIVDRHFEEKVAITVG